MGLWPIPVDVVEEASGLLCPPTFQVGPEVGGAHSVRQAGSSPGRAQAGGLRYYLVLLPRGTRNWLAAIFPACPILVAGAMSDP